MSEEIKISWDNTEILAVKDWYESPKGFEQIERENNFPVGTLFKIVNSNQDYKGTRCSIGKWLRNELRQMEGTQTPPVKNAPKRKKKMQKKTSLHTSVPEQEKIERQLMRELEEARKKIARLEAQQKKDSLRRDFLEGQLEEYRKLVKPSQSKNRIPSSCPSAHFSRTECLGGM